MPLFARIVYVYIKNSRNPRTYWREHVKSVFLQCKVMVEKLELFTNSVLTKHKDLVVAMAEDLLKNETIVYQRIKELLPDDWKIV
jgi:ATP-dependent Zn protease